MRSPAHTMAGHLMWTRTGAVWATWRLEALPYGYKSRKDKEEARLLHQALIRSRRGENLLLSLCATMDPAAIVERMIDGVDLGDCPDWAAECEASLDTLDDLGVGERTFWLSVPLGDASMFGRAAEAWRANYADLRDRLGLPRPGIPAREVEQRLAQASAIEKTIPGRFRPTPATVAQQVWIQLHAQQRGLFRDVDLPDQTGGVSADLLTPRSGTCMPEPWLDEGAQTDLNRKSLRSWNPLTRRYVKIMQPNAPVMPPASYQALLALSDVPDEGMLFPGSEFLGRIDECGLEVDWAMRLTVRSSEEVSRENRRALINLNEQYGQREGELSHGLNVLDRAATDLAEYVAILDSDKLEVETRPTIVFCVGAPDAEGALDQAGELSRYLEASGYKLAQPVGEQTDLWWSMIPGTPATKVVREYAQITTSRALSATVPLASTRLGDIKGPILGINISSGYARPGVVHHDIFNISRRDGSASVAIAGEKGGGKSLLMKTMAGYVLDAGGRFIATDRTSMGEWAHWAASVTRAVVVDVANPMYSMDPLRLLGTDVGARAAQRFLTQLCNFEAWSDESTLLSELLAPNYLIAHQLTSLGEVLQHLLDGSCDRPGADQLGRRMNVAARMDLGRVIFDSTLPVLDRDAPGIVIRTHGLEMPKPRELEHEHLFKQMSPEKIFGRAIYALIGALARRICFSDRSQLAVYFLDEASYQTTSPEGLEEGIDFLRDDRKHNAAIVLGSQDPGYDFGNETLRGLIPYRIQLRQSDKTIARSGLKWLDMDEHDAELLDILVSDTSPRDGNGVVPEHRRGEGFMRDSSGSIGRIKVLAPSLPERNEAVRTTPPEAQAHSSPEVV